MHLDYHHHSLPPILTAALDTADVNPNTAGIKLNLCRLLGIDCTKTPLTSTNLPKVKGGAKKHVSTKPKPKGKCKGSTGHKGSTGSKFSGGKNQIKDKHHADGGNGGSADGGSASSGPGGSLIGLTALNFNSCNGGNGGAANGTGGCCPVPR
ncbi:hypothetical protein OC844_005323 [Tilletia horrida]|nr:hypothetical protein OC844_005323 [Tilletia horrida]